MKISRNELCPCGSGKKYKKCCLPKDLEKAEKAKVEEIPIDIEQAYQESCEFDALSNSVIDFIQLGQFDEAEEVCQRMMIEHPQMVDGLERMARLCEAKGENVKAAVYHRKTAEFMRANDGFEPENIQWHLDQAEHFEKIKDN